MPPLVRVAVTVCSVPSGFEAVSGSSVRTSVDADTVTVTVPVAVPPLPSETVYVNESGPL